MPLPQIDRSQLDLRPIDWSGLGRRFMNEGELEVLVALLRPVAPEVVIEVGVNEGRTAKCLLRELPSIGRYWGIDVPRSCRPTLALQRHEVPQQPGAQALDNARFRLLLARRGTFDLGPGELPRADAIFIDGDHSADAVARDSRDALVNVRPGGIVVWHDYNDIVGVKPVLDRLAAEEGLDIRHVAGTWLAWWRAPTSEELVAQLAEAAV